MKKELPLPVVIGLIVLVLAVAIGFFVASGGVGPGDTSKPLPGDYAGPPPKQGGAPAPETTGE